jgi:hypothetical protein
MPISAFKGVLASLVLLALCESLWSQSKLDACEVIQQPEKYSGQVVEITGIVHYDGFEEFSFTGADCEKLPLNIWLAYPYEAEVITDPSLNGRRLKFVKNRESKRFDQLMRQRCGGRRFVATLRGAFQYKKETLIHSDGKTQIVGFGHMGMYSSRLVILSVEAARALPCSDKVR